MRVYDFSLIEFTEQIDSTFARSADWSVAFVGKLKYSSFCDKSIPNRAPFDKNRSTTVTYLIDTNLEMQTYVDGNLVAWSNTKQDSVSARSDKHSFSIDTTFN
jgi:hypothetical protein